MNDNYIFVTFKKGRKEYTATVSSWQYDDHKNLWLYVFGDFSKGGNCGYIKNARVTETSRATMHKPYIPPETLKILRAWID